MNRGGWIQTYTGKKFYPLDPQPKDICFEDIAHALANTCRYNGHSKLFYSVAEHCVRMCVADLPGCPKWRLMHDAAEAYISDCPRPIKPMLSGFQGLEDRIMKVISRKFNLGEPDLAAVNYADNVMLATEKRDVLLPGPKWGTELPPPLDEKIHPLTNFAAEHFFIFQAKILNII